MVRGGRRARADTPGGLSRRSRSRRGRSPCRSARRRARRRRRLGACARRAARGARSRAAARPARAARRRGARHGAPRRPGARRRRGAPARWRTRGAPASAGAGRAGDLDRRWGSHRGSPPLRSFCEGQEAGSARLIPPRPRYQGRRRGLLWGPTMSALQPTPHPRRPAEISVGVDIVDVARIERLLGRRPRRRAPAHRGRGRVLPRPPGDRRARRRAIRGQGGRAQGPRDGPERGPAVDRRRGGERGGRAPPRPPAPRGGRPGRAPRARRPGDLAVPHRDARHRPRDGALDLARPPRATHERRHDPIDHRLRPARARRRPRRPAPGRRRPRAAEPAHRRLHLGLHGGGHAGAG